jgi:hypothetical protein
MEIARAAAGLFVRQGLRATRAEDIAQAAGVAPRTFYRYFASKEEAVAPLYAAGAERWTDAVAAAPADLPLPQVLEHAVHHTLTPGAGVSAASWELVRTLIRLTDSSPALGKVWAEVCHAAETRLAEVLEGRASGGSGGVGGSEGSGGSGGVRGSEGSGGLGGAVGSESSGGAGEAVGSEGSGGAGRVRGSEGSSGSGGAVGSEGSGGSGGSDNVGTGAGGVPVNSSALRFAAAVAGAAVRVAVESWAAGTAPASGPKGPAALALRNLETLRAFPWAELVEG